MLNEFTHKKFGSVVARFYVRYVPGLNLAIYSNRCDHQKISAVSK